MLEFGSGGEAHHAVLTGDVVASRSAAGDQRAQLQEVLLEVLGELNEELGEALERPLVLTAGDEIQGLFRAPSRIVEATRVLSDRLYGIGEPGREIVFGVGWGELSTGLREELAAVEHLDGPCFHSARASLERAKKGKRWVVLDGFGEVESGVLSSLFELMGAIRSGWTSKQSFYIQELRTRGRRIDVARGLGVSPSVVTESLQSARFTAVERGEEAARELLGKYDRGTGREDGERG
jgi:hypothetical protein